MADDVYKLEERVTRHEDIVAQGFARIETLILRELQALRDNNLRHIEDTIARVEMDTKGTLARIENDVKEKIADVKADQRTLWGRLTALEDRSNRRDGSSSAFKSLFDAIKICAGGGIGSFLTWLLSGHGSPPPH